MTNEAGLEFENIEKPKTLRDEIAIAAMQGCIDGARDISDSAENIAYWAYRMADSMLKERNK